MSINKVSIIVPVFNKFPYTRNCVKNLSFLSLETHEIIVVDDGSSDETQAEMSKISSDFIRYIRSDKNEGFAKTCNKGYSASTGNIIVFLNNDIKFISNQNTWTQNITTVIMDDMLVGPSGGFVDPKNNFQFVYETKDASKTINYMSGWCLAATKTTFDKLKTEYGTPFSEEFGKAYFEDSDLSFRAAQLGIKFKLIDVPLKHIGKVSSSQMNVNKLYSSAREIFAKKWSNKF